eukprot:1016575-Amphidinium_carterae.1
MILSITLHICLKPYELSINANPRASLDLGRPTLAHQVIVKCTDMASFPIAVLRRFSRYRTNNTLAKETTK